MRSRHLYSILIWLLLAAMNTPTFASDSGEFPTLTPPTIDTFSVPGQACPWDTVPFFASASIPAPDSIVGYDWDFGDGQVGSGAITNHVYTAGGSYTWRLSVVSDTGCITIQIGSIVVLPGPAVNLGNDTTLCQGDSIVLDAGSGAQSYLWSDSSMGQTLVVSDSGTYHVAAVDSNGCLARDTIRIDLSPLPQVSLDSLNLRYCVSEGQDTLSGFPVGGIFSGPGIIDPLQGIFLPSSASVGIYHITYTVTDSNGCTGSDTDSTFVDNSLVVWYRDYDADSFGYAGDTLIQCIQPAGYVNVPGDCDDSTALVNPGHIEICGDGLDNDCNPLTLDSMPVTATVLQASCPTCSDGSIDISILGGTPPYSYSWSPGGNTTEDLTGILPGNYTVQIQDASGGCVHNDSFLVPTLPTPQAPFSIPPVNSPCGTDTFSICLVANQPVPLGIIGLNLCLGYDTTLMRPTGNMTFGPVITNQLLNPPSGVGFGFYDHRDSSQVWANIFYQGITPSPVFDGAGEVVCIEFVMEPGAPLGAISTLAPCQFLLTTTTGSYTTPVDPGYFSVVGDSILDGQLRFWNETGGIRPIGYDTLNPNNHPQTGLYPGDSLCNPLASMPTYPDTSGLFGYAITHAASFIIRRDIIGDSVVNPGCIDVIDYINGMDVVLANIWATPIPTDTPNAYQMIAADVNMNDSITASDAGLIAQRAQMNICEFPQVWNYTLDSLGNPVPNTNYQPSWDWRFVDSVWADTASDFIIDGLYPFANNSDPDLGFWRFNVPEVPTCYQVDTSGPGFCPSNDRRVFMGVLLGDLDGNWQPGPAPVSIRTSENDRLVFDLLNMVSTGNGYFRIPVSYRSSHTIHALDFTMDYDESKMTIQTAGTSQSGMEVWQNDYMQEQLRFISVSMAGLNTEDPVGFIEVAAGPQGPTLDDLGFIKGYLNGERVNVEILYDALTEGQSAEYGSNGWLSYIYPNPAENQAFLEYQLVASGKDKVKVTVFDALGRQMAHFADLSANGKLQLDVADWAGGGYVVLLTKNDQVIDRKKFFVIH